MNRLPERLGDLLPRVVAGFSVPSEPAKDTDMAANMIDEKEWLTEVKATIRAELGSDHPEHFAAIGLLGKYEAQLVEIERLRRIEATAAKYVHAGLCGNHSLPLGEGAKDHAADYDALVAAVRTNPDFRG